MYIYQLITMSKESEREAIKDETHQVHHQEQEELDEIQEEEVEREKDTFSNNDRSKKKF
jgi:hypothetical protein